MNDQERNFVQEIHPETCNLDDESLKFLAMIRCNSYSSPSAAATTPPSTGKSSVSSNFHRISKKRGSPSSLEQKLLSKRTALSPPSTTAVNILSPPLQRSFSEPINYNQTAHIAETSSRKEFNSENNNSVAKSASLPPLPPPLRRTASTPVPSTITPPRPRAAASSTSQITDQESPSTKKWKRMKETMQEMSERFHEIMREEDEVVVSEDESKKGDESECGTQEAVWVDEIPGGGLDIHFKCQCGKTYEVLLFGGNCYYKLM